MEYIPSHESLQHERGQHAYMVLYIRNSTTKESDKLENSFQLFSFLEIWKTLSASQLLKVIVG